MATGRTTPNNLATNSQKLVPPKSTNHNLRFDDYRSDSDNYRDLHGLGATVSVERGFLDRDDTVEGGNTFDRLARVFDATERRLELERDHANPALGDGAVVVDRPSSATGKTNAATAPARSASPGSSDANRPVTRGRWVSSRAISMTRRRSRLEARAFASVGVHGDRNGSLRGDPAHIATQTRLVDCTVRRHRQDGGGDQAVEAHRARVDGSESVEEIGLSRVIMSHSGWNDM